MIKCNISKFKLYSNFVVTNHESMRCVTSFQSLFSNNINWLRLKKEQISAGIHSKVKDYSFTSLTSFQKYVYCYTSLGHIYITYRLVCLCKDKVEGMEVLLGEVNVSGFSFLEVILKYLKVIPNMLLGYIWFNITIIYFNLNL